MCDQVGVLSFINTFSTVEFYERFVFHIDLFLWGFYLDTIFFPIIVASYFHVLFIHVKVKPELTIKIYVITMITYTVIILVAHLSFKISLKCS